MVDRVTRLAMSGRLIELPMPPQVPRIQVELRLFESSVAQRRKCTVVVSFWSGNYDIKSSTQSFI
jgi:hypothetical protein